MTPKRCPATYPGSATLNGKPVRCDGLDGHGGRHGNGFAARYWDTPPTAYRRLMRGKAIRPKGGPK